MQKHIYLLLLSVAVAFLSCQKPKKKFSTSQFDPTSKQFEFLKEPLKNIKVLALGESSHGFGSLQTLKSNLVQYLHQELDYNVLIFEGGYGDIKLSWLNREGSSAKQLLGGSVPANMQSKQMLPLFEYLVTQEEKPIVMRGMDTNMSGKGFKFKLMYIIRRLEPKIIQDSIEKGLSYYYRPKEILENKDEWIENTAQYLQTLDFTKSIIEESKQDILELELAKEEEVGVLLDNIEILKKAAKYTFGESISRGLVIRDSLMAENVFEVVEKEFPNTKVLIWGHNGHIEKGPGEGDNIKWVGHYLKEKYGDKYYALGMYVKKGFIYQTQERKTSNFEIKSPSFIETKIHTDYGKNVFIDIPPYDETNTNWVNKPIDGYELEAGGRVRFIPSKRFDGILFMEETEAPDYSINESRR